MRKNKTITAMNPKITIPILGFNRSGGMRVLTQIANHLADNGWRVHLLVPYGATEPQFPLSENIVIETYKLSSQKLLRLLSAWITFIRISCRDTDVCLAYYYTIAHPIWLSWLLHKRKARIVYLQQGYKYKQPTPPKLLTRLNPRRVRKLKMVFLELTYKLPFQRIAVSSWVQANMKKTMTVIPNGVDTNIFFPAAAHQQNNQFVIGTIARGKKAKGFDIFLKAIQPIMSRPEFTIHVLSDDPPPMPPGLKLIRPQSDDDIRVFYQGCDVFVFPSIREGFGLPPLEAMACGTPVILSDSGGVREYAHEENALIVPIYDSNAILEAIMHLHRHPELQEKLRTAGIETSKKFTLAVMLERYLAYFDALLTT